MYFKVRSNNFFIKIGKKNCRSKVYTSVFISKIKKYNLDFNKNIKKHLKKK